MSTLARFAITLAALAPLALAVADAAVSAERSKGSADRVVGLRFKEPKQTEFLKAVLKSMNLSYTVTVTPEGRFEGRLLPAFIEAPGHPVLR